MVAGKICHAITIRHGRNLTTLVDSNFDMEIGFSKTRGALHTKKYSYRLIVINRI
jgi:hypothetical protein